MGRVRGAVNARALSLARKAVDLCNRWRREAAAECLVEKQVELVSFSLSRCLLEGAWVSQKFPVPLSIFFLGVFAIALRRRCMAGAGSNMLRVHAYVKLLAVTTWIMAIWPFLSSWSGSFILWFNIGFEIPTPTLTSTLLQLVVTGTAWVVRSEVVLAVAHSTVLVLLSGIGAVPVLSWEILLWRAAYLASLGACLWVVRAGARHLLWCILGSQGAKHAALASCGVAGKPC